MQRIVKAYEDITMTETAPLDDQWVVSPVYSVGIGNNPASTQRFGDMVAADIYFEELVLRYLGL